MSVDAPSRTVRYQTKKETYRKMMEIERRKNSNAAAAKAQEILVQEKVKKV